MGQLACLEKDLLIDPIKSSIEITPGDFYFCLSFCRNLLPIDHIKDKLAKNLDPIINSHLGSTSPALSRKPAPGLTLVPTLIAVLIPVLALALILTNELIKKFIKAYFETNQGIKQPPAERVCHFKVQVPEIYYGKLHINCYHFCR